MLLLSSTATHQLEWQRLYANNTRHRVLLGAIMQWNACLLKRDSFGHMHRDPLRGDLRTIWSSRLHILGRCCREQH